MPPTGAPFAITYLCPIAKNKPIGGVKVIHKHAEILADAGFDCAVFQPAGADTTPAWFESRAPMRADNAFHRDRDFLVIPEIWAAEYGKQCRDRGIRYAVFVQNGYTACVVADNSSSADLRAAYDSAAFVLAISEDTAAILSLMFKLTPEKILRVLPHVGERFSPGPKARLISYMPRKLPDHSRILSDYLLGHLPREWELAAIHLQDEAAVASKLAATSIFLSFSHQEGFGLPPLEAALSGAIVVGYTGEGGAEFFREPNFLTVHSGDIRGFIAALERALAGVTGGLLDSAPFQEGIARLRATYSRENERARLVAFAEKARDTFAL